MEDAGRFHARVCAILKRPEARLAYGNHARERARQRGVNLADVWPVILDGRPWTVSLQQQGDYSLKLYGETPDGETIMVCVVIKGHETGRPKVKVTTVGDT